MLVLQIVALRDIVDRDSVRNEKFGRLDFSGRDPIVHDLAHPLVAGSLAVSNESVRGSARFDKGTVRTKGKRDKLTEFLAP